MKTDQEKAMDAWYKAEVRFDESLDWLIHAAQRLDAAYDAKIDANHSQHVDTAQQALTNAACEHVKAKSALARRLAHMQANYGWKQTAGAGA